MPGSRKRVDKAINEPRTASRKSSDQVELPLILQPECSAQRVKKSPCRLALRTAQTLLGKDGGRFSDPCGKVWHYPHVRLCVGKGLAKALQVDTGQKREHGYRRTGERLKFLGEQSKLLRLEPLQDPDAGCQWMTAEYPDLDLQVTAPTRSALVDAVRDELAFLWEQYVLDTASPLSPSGGRLRATLLSLFEEVANAAR